MSRCQIILPAQTRKKNSRPNMSRQSVSTALKRVRNVMWTLTGEHRWNPCKKKIRQSCHCPRGDASQVPACCWPIVAQGKGSRWSTLSWRSSSVQTPKSSANTAVTKRKNSKLPWNLALHPLICFRPRACQVVVPLLRHRANRVREVVVPFCHSLLRMMML